MMAPYHDATFPLLLVLTRVSCGFLGRLFSTMSVKTGQFCVPINQISMGTNKDDKGKEEGATKDEALA